MLETIIISDGAIFAALLLFRISAPAKFARVFYAAKILAGIVEAVAKAEADAAAAESRWQRFRVKVAAVPAIVRAALLPSPDGLPVVATVMIAAGVAVPIVGPVDEAAAVAVVAGCAGVPEYRRRIVAAWSLAGEVAR